MVLAWENFRRFLWCWPSLCCCCCSSFIFIRRCFSFCWCCIFICFSDPWRSPPALSSTPTTFDSLFFFIYRERYGFEWTFFTLHSICFYQGFAGRWQLLSWKLQGFILILETQARPTCLFDSQLPKVCIYACQYCKSFTCDENFDKISSHTIQQPRKNKAAAKLTSNQNIIAYLNCSLKKCISRYNCN